MNKNNLFRKIFKRNTIFSAHSMDTSFYALHNGILVEFKTGEDGIIPHDYPSHDEVSENLVRVVQDCADFPRIKKELASLKIRYYKDFSITEERLLRFEAPYILRDFIYGYSVSGEWDEAYFINAVLKGEIDEFGNTYRYDLTTQPTIPCPERLLTSIRVHLPFLPHINLNTTVLFPLGEAKEVYGDTNPDSDLLVIKDFLSKIVRSSAQRNRFFKIARSRPKTRSSSPSCLLVSYSKIDYGQKALLAIMEPSFVRTLKKEKLVCLSCLNDAPQSKAIAENIKKICPQAAIPLVGLSQLATLLQIVFPEK